MLPDDQKVRRAKKVVDAGMNIPLAQLQESIELNDKLEALLSKEVIFPEYPEPVEQVTIKNLPEVQKVEITNLPEEKDDVETQDLLRELIAEVKKKEQYAYDIEIDPALKEQLKGEPGKDGTTPVKGIDYFTKDDKEEFISLISKEVNSEEIVKKIKDGKKLSIQDISGLTDILNNISQQKGAVYGRAFEYLRNLADVSVTSPTNGQALVYDSSTQKWKNGTVSGGSSLTIQEVDGTPSGTPSILKMPNGSLTDNGDGSFTFAASGSGTVTNVSSANSDISVANPTSTPVLTLNSATTATADTIVKRDSNNNIYSNNYFPNTTATVSSGGTTVLTVASSRIQRVTGSSSHTFQLPDATTLPTSSIFEFDNNSSGSITIQNASGVTQYTLSNGGDVLAKCTNNSTSNGTWDFHALAPSIVSWSSGVSGLQMNNALNTTPLIQSGASSSTTPSFIPQRVASTTGFGGDGTNLYGTIGGVARLTISSSGITATNLSGTNTGDQTSIVGITGTKAQFNTAVTDGDFLYVGDVTQYTDEQAQDAVGAMVDTSLVYVDGTPLLSRAALTGDVTASQGSNTTTLATVNSNVGSFGSASSVATFTVNAKGLITAAASTAISIASSAITDFASSVRGTVLTGLSLASTTVISATDTVLVALGSLQAQITALTTTVGNKVSSVGATGPITSSGGTTPTISTSMATNKLIGRGTAGTGVMEEITIGTGLSLTGTTLNATGSGGTITTQDEGSTLSTTVTTLNFTGAGVTASGSGSTTTINISGGSGSFSATETEIDFGNKPVYDKTITVTDAGITSSSKIIVTESGNPATGQGTGDTLWDSITYSAVAGTGSFTLYARPTPGPVMGKRKIYYTVA